MTLTVCVGSSGSGKTTFLNDVHKSHKCTYIRQYHNLRPFIAVSAIPSFEPTKLPYWDIYMEEKKAHNIIVGGTIAGQFMAGLSGGQRKLLLFELIFQRTLQQDNLLIVLDEPFAGVTVRCERLRLTFTFRFNSKLYIYLLFIKKNEKRERVHVYVCEES